jgi:hypothetical protein
MLGNGKILILCAGLFLFLKSPAQNNLIPNASFELISTCPFNYGQIDTVISWGIPINGGGGNPEVYNSCATNPNVGVPFHFNNQGFQEARTGNGYVGIDAGASYTDDAREYIQSKLLNKLITGKVYCIKFYCNLSNWSRAFIKPLGAYLDNGDVSATSTSGLIELNPQVYSQQLLSDTINWMKIEGYFTANGTEEYLTIGNFFKNVDSEVSFPSSSPSSWVVYYYIDDVSVIDINTPAYAGVNTTIAIGDSVFIGRTPEIGLNEDCIWYVDGIPIDTVAGLWVMPDSTTTYILEQTICGYTTYDTVTVTVLPTNINELFKENNLRLYPNPNDGTFTIEHNLNGNNYVLEIVDVMGNTVHHEILTNGNQQKIETKQLSSGIYFVKILNQQQQVSSHVKMSVVR